MQEALLAASSQWPADGVPDSPARLAGDGRLAALDGAYRNESARWAREEKAAALEPPAPPEPVPDADDTLAVLVLCCHPALTSASQIALTLRAVGGLTTAEIARALLVPEKTVGQRVSRAKRTIAAAGGAFHLPPPAELPARVDAVRQVLYLIFNEGYTATSGDALHRVELSTEAIRLARRLHSALPDEGEAAGLLALMLLTDARRPARTRGDGALVPLTEQDRSLWDAAKIAEGIALVESRAGAGPVGPFQLQAAIAAVHDEAARPEDTDWPQILGLYELLDRLAPQPMVTLNRIVAIAEVQGPAVALAELDGIDLDHHRVDAVRAHLLDMAGDHPAAREHYRRAARRTLSRPERRYLESRAGAN